MEKVYFLEGGKNQRRGPGHSASLAILSTRRGTKSLASVTQGPQAGLRTPAPPWARAFELHCSP